MPFVLFQVHDKHKPELGMLARPMVRGLLHLPWFVVLIAYTGQIGMPLGPRWSLILILPVIVDYVYVFLLLNMRSRMLATMVWLAGVSLIFLAVWAFSQW